MTTENSVKMPHGVGNAFAFQVFNTMSFTIVLSTPMLLYFKRLDASATVLGIVVALPNLLNILQIPAAQFVEKMGYRAFVLRGWLVRALFIMAMAVVRGRTLPQCLLGQAIDYALKRWEALTRFVEDGALEIDNNLIENAIRPSALGKRNWLFIGHPEAGERSAVIYTLLGSCRRQGVNPFDYLNDLFTRLPAAKITEIKQFTPSEWAGSCQTRPELFYRTSRTRRG